MIKRMNLNKEYLKVCLSDYLNQSINQNDITIARFEAQVGDGNKKDFYRVIVKDQSFILKKYPNSDVSICLSNDQDFREFQFAQSKLFTEINSAIKIPIIATYMEVNERWILMEDVTESLREFGPPILPTKSILTNMLYKVGQFHALTFENHNLFNKNEWFMKFDEFVYGGCRILQAIIDKRSDEPSINEYLDEHPDVIEAFINFMNWLEDEEKNKLIEIISNPKYILNKLDNSQKAICHNDLYYGNIGIEKDNLTIIDWEFVGIAPTVWDVYNLFSGIPCPDLKENEGFEIYFSGLESNGLKVEKKEWVKHYRLMGDISTLFELRVLIPKIFSNNSQIPEDKKLFIQNHVRQMIQQLIHHVN